MSIVLDNHIEPLLIDKTARLWASEDILDPLLDPFSHHAAADILLIDKHDLLELRSSNFVSATCSLNDFKNCNPKFLCYWDIIEATVFMSLITFGLQAAKATEMSNTLCDFLAYHQETASPEEKVDVFALSEIIENCVNMPKFIELQHIRTLELDQVCLKLAVDVLNTHTRCLLYLSRIRRGGRNDVRSSSVDILGSP